MTLINNEVKDLLNGYDKISQAESNLSTQWRDRLLRAYKLRRQKYAAANKKYRQRLAILPEHLAIGVVIVLLLFFPLYFVSLGLALVELAIGFFLVICYGFWQAVIAKPQPPPHPLESPLRERLFPTRLPTWRAQLNGRLPRTITKDGDVGEHRLIERLQRVLDHSHFILYSVQPLPNDDIDVMVVGPKGIWVFEVKYWAGEIIWQNGRWRRFKQYYKPGGIPVEEEIEVGQPPNLQWQRMADQVTKTLHSRAKQLIFTTPELLKIRGGIVFTHPKAEYKIASGCPFSWGTISGWEQALKKAPPLAGVTERKVMGVVQALLFRHQELNRPSRGGYSLEGYADQLIRQTESGVVAWIKDS